MIIDTKILVVALLLASHLGIGYVGYKLADSSCTADKAVFNAKQNEMLTKATTEKAEKDNAIRNSFSAIQSDVSAYTKDIMQSYTDALSASLSDLNVDTSNGVQQSGSASTSSDKSVSDNSSTSDRVSGSADKCREGYTKKLQKLYEQQLVIAKDCDITATYYNSLLKLYHEIENQNGK